MKNKDLENTERLTTIERVYHMEREIEHLRDYVKNNNTMVWIVIIHSIISITISVVKLLQSPN